MKYYKVVSTNENNEHFSYAVYSSKYRIQYLVNEWVRPKIGKIFIFDSFENAFNFLSEEGYVNKITLETFNGYCIFECEAENVQQLSEMGEPDEYSIESYWLNKNRLKNTPVGTLGASAIKLTNKVKNG